MTLIFIGYSTGQALPGLLATRSEAVIRYDGRAEPARPKYCRLHDGGRLELCPYRSISPHRPGDGDVDRARQIRPDEHDALVLCSIGGALAVRRADLPPPLDQLQGSGTDANRLWRRAGGISALWHALPAGARRLDRKL